MFCCGSMCCSLFGLETGFFVESIFFVGNAYENMFFFHALFCVCMCCSLVAVLLMDVRCSMCLTCV